MQKSFLKPVFLIEPKILDIGEFKFNKFWQKRLKKNQKIDFSEDNFSWKKNVSSTANSGELLTSRYLH